MMATSKSKTEEAAVPMNGAAPAAKGHDGEAAIKAKFLAFKQAQEAREEPAEVKELRAALAEAEADVKALEIELAEVRAAQAREKDATRLLLLRQKSDALPLTLAAARLTAKVAELALTEREAQEEAVDHRELREIIAAKERANREAQDELLAMRRYAANQYSRQSTYREKVRRLREETAALEATLRGEAQAPVRRARPSLALGGG
jgi:chromosome segregation ATPase